MIDDSKALTSDLIQLARLAISQTPDDVRLFVAKLVRKHRTKNPEFAENLQQILKGAATRAAVPSVLRRGPVPAPTDMPVDADSRQSLIRVFDDRRGMEPPILPPDLAQQLDMIVLERHERDRLAAAGVFPTRSAVLVGPPGVGKTLSARWLATKLQKPLWVLDLTTVMSSLLGKTGSNLRAVFDHAKASEAVLLLDEIDAIAKRRGDDSDIGELKRLVAGILQEVDAWPDSGLLLAATNHPELVDPALWRRFDAVLNFDPPTQEQIEDGIRRFLGLQGEMMGAYIGPLAGTFAGQSLSDIERSINTMRRQMALSDNPTQILLDSTLPHLDRLDKQARKQLAMQMAKSHFSHNHIHELTGVSRDTIRKYAGPSPIKGRGRRKEK